jgi:CRP/FNR family transcriptional regulator, cyclic AMP receptor protein
VASVTLTFVGSAGQPASGHVVSIVRRVERANRGAGLVVELLDADVDTGPVSALDAWITPTVVVSVDGWERGRLTGPCSHRALLHEVLPALHEPSRAGEELRRQLDSPGEQLPSPSSGRRRGRGPRVELLGGVALFASLTKAQLREVAAVCDEAVFASGAVVMEQGEPGDEMFVVVDGLLEVRRAGRRIATLSAGDHVGEMSLLDDLPRSATVRALDEVTVLVIDRSTFRSLLVTMPEIAVALLAALSQRLRG